MSPRTKKQLLELRERSRKAIMKNALRLFAQNGFHQTTVQQIARRAGVSKGLVYNYFTSKEDLLESIIRAGLEEAQKVTMHIFSQPAARDKMKTMIDCALTPDLLQ
jgi:AcrR family transcriptional regulator